MASGEICEAGICFDQCRLHFVSHFGTIQTVTMNHMQDVQTCSPNFMDHAELWSHHPGFVLVYFLFEERAAGMLENAIALTFANIERMAITRIDQPINVPLQFSMHL